MFLGQGVSFAVQACYFILLARLLGADQYGIFVGAAAAVSLLSQYSTLGSGLVLVRQVSRHNSEFPQYWGNVLVTTLSVGLLVILGPRPFRQVDGRARRAHRSSCWSPWASAPARGSPRLRGQAFQAFEQLKLTAVLTSLTSIARLLTAAGMVLVLHRATRAPVGHRFALASLAFRRRWRWSW